YAALKEFRRIVKPRGRLALMWNVRDDADVFTSRYGEVVRRAQEDAKRRGRTIGNEHAGDPTLGGFFHSPQMLTFANPQMLDMQGLLGRARSASYFPKPDNPLRIELENELPRLFALHQRGGRVTLLHRTE